MQSCRGYLPADPAAEGKSILVTLERNGSVAVFGRHVSGGYAELLNRIYVGLNQRAAELKVGCVGAIE